MATRDLTPQFNLYKTGPEGRSASSSPAPRRSALRSMSPKVEASSSSQSVVTEVQATFTRLIEAVDMNMAQLEALYKDFFYKLIPQKIEKEKSLVGQISAQLRSAQKCLLELKQYQAPSSTEQMVIKALHRSLFDKYRERVIQMRDLMASQKKQYELSGADPFEDESPALETFGKDQSQALETSNEARLAHREKEIIKIAQEVVAINQLFMDLDQMVCDQGTVMDTIQHNMEMTKERVDKGTEDLGKADEQQKQNASLKNKTIVFLTGLVVSLGVVLGVRKV